MYILNFVGSVMLLGWRHLPEACNPVASPWRMHEHGTSYKAIASCMSIGSLSTDHKANSDRNNKGTGTTITDDCRRLLGYLRILDTKATKIVWIYISIERTNRHCFHFFLCEPYES